MWVTVKNNVIIIIVIAQWKNSLSRCDIVGLLCVSVWF